MLCHGCVVSVMLCDPQFKLMPAWCTTVSRLSHAILWYYHQYLYSCVYLAPEKRSRCPYLVSPTLTHMSIPLHSDMKSALCSSSRFSSYADYITHVVANCGHLHLDNLADALVHGGIPSGGMRGLVKVSVLLLHKGNQFSSLEYSPGSHESLYRNLKDDCLTVEYQIVLLPVPYLNAPIPKSVVDAVGLGLETPPDIWFHLLMRRQKPERQASPHLWHWKDSVLEVGNDLLLLQKQTVKRPTSTGAGNIETFTT